MKEDYVYIYALGFRNSGVAFTELMSLLTILNLNRMEKINSLKLLQSEQSRQNWTGCDSWKTNHPGGDEHVFNFSEETPNHINPQEFVVGSDKLHRSLLRKDLLPSY